jgi:hypothetical protein
VKDPNVVSNAFVSHVAKVSLSVTQHHEGWRPVDVAHPLRETQNSAQGPTGCPLYRFVPPASVPGREAVQVAVVVAVEDSSGRVLLTRRQPHMVKHLITHATSLRARIFTDMVFFMFMRPSARFQERGSCQGGESMVKKAWHKLHIAKCWRVRWVAP